MKCDMAAFTMDSVGEFNSRAVLLFGSHFMSGTPMTIWEFKESMA